MYRSARRIAKVSEKSSRLIPPARGALPRISSLGFPSAGNKTKTREQHRAHVTSTSNQGGRGTFLAAPAMDSRLPNRGTLEPTGPWGHSSGLPGASQQLDAA